jgi:hypothetical protein
MFHIDVHTLSNNIVRTSIEHKAKGFQSYRCDNDDFLIRWIFQYAHVSDGREQFYF